MEASQIFEKYKPLFSCKNLENGEDLEIFAAIKAGVNVDFNKERLFNAFFKKIYREAWRAIRMGIADDLDDIISYISYYFYKGIGTFDPDNGACFYTHISNWISGAILNFNRTKSNKNLMFVAGDAPDEQADKLQHFYYNYESGVDIFDNICQQDFLNKIDEFLINENIENDSKNAFLDYYGLNRDKKSAKNIAQEQGVSIQTVMNRKNGIEKKLKEHFNKDRLGNFYEL